MRAWEVGTAEELANRDKREKRIAVFMMGAV